MTNKTIAELREWLSRVDCGEISMSIHETFNDGKQVMKDVVLFKLEILSRAEAVEPLAITASKFGMSVYSRKRIKGFVPELAWGISLNRRGGASAFISYASTYAAAEAKARAYLMALEDKEGA